MRMIKDSIWTRFVPDVPREIDEKTWKRSGGKWIVFDREERINELSRKLAPHIDAGNIEGDKCWNGDPSAINVYALDRDRQKIRKLLKELGARGSMVWEYDYSLRKNLSSPFTFAFSWFSKFRTILQSRGIAGTLRLVHDVLNPQRDGA